MLWRQKIRQSNLLVLGVTSSCPQSTRAVENGQLSLVFYPALHGSIMNAAAVLAESYAGGQEQ
jgi:hypothetical protein